MRNHGNRLQRFLDNERPVTVLIIRHGIMRTHHWLREQVVVDRVL